MDEFTVTLSMVLGVLLRIGIPVGLTALLASFLKRLDAKWREEARQVQPGETILRELWLNNLCWGETDCAEEQRENCSVFDQKEEPCWEVFRENGSLNSKCQECGYRKELLIPTRINLETNRR